MSESAFLNYTRPRHRVPIAHQIMRFDLLTIFPDFFQSVLAYGVVSRALRSGLASVATHDLRSHTHDRHRTVDDRPFGGGEGMVLKVEPIAECLTDLRLVPKPERVAARQSVILLSAQGTRFTQERARELAQLERVVLICGRYEGVDERVSQLFCDAELSIGDYVLSGGELGAAVILDTVTRLLPGVLGHEDSARYDSFGVADAGSTVTTDAGVPRSTHSAGGLLDYPHYTRPAEFLGAQVPAVLSGGDHLAIRRWRRQAALEKTLRNRPDLLDAAILSPEDIRFLTDRGFER